MIRHVFMWSVTHASDGESVLAELATLGEAIPWARNWSIGRQMKTSSHSSVGDWQYILMADFASQEQLDAYQEDPLHTQIVERVLPHYKCWAVVDYQIDSCGAATDGDGEFVQTRG